MPRFYFHIVSARKTIEDEEGLELNDLLAAQAEAIASARDLALSAEGVGLEGMVGHIQIADISGVVLDTVSIRRDYYH